ncbi:peptidoglycan recognition protein [Actinomadura rayongensis]|uniref:N-acetylmuramoyl-L-alanine amidase n=1 Tax=Actinomadura rayongensis TaxID=1429076 RepID=A0A6I4WKX9_9ACTN|nr:peptidoglycan recognition protein [Actinomadura rayongensis]MXQ68366.1 N-acetylmuramoyl-L-alanine amidase [Actinomadura rayongensis]
MPRLVLAGASAVALVAAGGFVAFRTADAPSVQAVSAVRGPADPGRVAARSLRDLGANTRGLPAATTAPFSLVGVTWDRPRAELRGTVRVRTRARGTGTWLPWRSVATETQDVPDKPGKNVRGGTGALWTGPSDGIEVRVTGHGRTLPAGLRVDLVDPGTGRTTTRPTPRAAGGPVPVRLAAAVEPAGSPAPPVKAAAVAQPALVARAGWGADESLVKAPPTYDTSVKAVFVHHTDTGNDVACADSASAVRAIFLYHVQSQGWDDIGYNFLVDKCGTIFEGRAGGTDRPVHGAHTYGFNTDTTGVAVLGTYTSAQPSSAALDAVARLSAWKLGLTGVDPTGTTKLTSLAPDGTGGKYPYGTEVTFSTIAGHSDGFATECPGAQLYGKLPALRTAARNVTWPVPATTLAGAAKSGTRYYTKGAVTLGWKATGAESYEVRVDGKVVAQPAGTATSAAVTLAAGAHTLALRAVYAGGKVSDAPAYAVTADATKPVFGSGAALSLRRSTVNTTAAPVTLGWKVTDNTLLAGVRATSPSAKTFPPTTTSWSATAKPGSAQTWALTATDAAGNAATSSVSRTAALVAEQSAYRKGTWRTTTTSSYLGGRGLYSSSRGAYASWTFTGRSVGLIVKRAANTGAVTVYVDGTKAGTLDTRASTTAYRQLAWTKAWSSSAKHTIKIVVAGTSGRAVVGIDGIAYLR